MKEKKLNELAYRKIGRKSGLLGQSTGKTYQTTSLVLDIQEYFPYNKKKPAHSDAMKESVLRFARLAKGILKYPKRDSGFRRNEQKWYHGRFARLL